MLYYVPLESYKERYTMQWSAPGTGWVERNLRNAGVEYIRIDPTDGRAAPVKTGCVLDPVRRSKFCFNQIAMLLDLADAGYITDNDSIYFDDFWHPGIEALPYTFDQMLIHPEMYAFCHAQSVDRFDFTHRMRHWMRPFEVGIGRVLNGVFVSCPALKDLLVEGGVAQVYNVHPTGFPLNTEEVIERMPQHWSKTGGGHRDPKVVWSSRWDKEKNPEFFLLMAEQVIKEMPNAGFLICTGADKIRSNDPSLLKSLHHFLGKYPQNIYLLEGLTKEEYYQALCTSKVQFNCASQDFFSITLLEASIAGAWPMYPYFRSFPDALADQRGFMYEHLNLPHAVRKVKEILSWNDDPWKPVALIEREWIHKRFETSHLRMLKVMGLYAGTTEEPYKRAEATSHYGR